MTSWHKDMHRFCFIMDDLSRHWVVARDMREAMLVFDSWRLDPRDIAAIEEHQ